MAKSKEKQSPTTGKCWRYEDISLRLFLEIAKDGDVSKLLIEGEADLDEAWEEIIRKNQQSAGSNRYDNYFEKAQTYALIVHEYILVRSALVYLSEKVDGTVAEMLIEKGYKIDPKDYLPSIERAFHKAENLVTRAMSKQKEMELLKEDKKGDSSFEEVMANLVVGLGFQVSDDITLARYNEYLKIIKKKNGGTGKKRRMVG